MASELMPDSARSTSVMKPDKNYDDIVLKPVSQPTSPLVNFEVAYKQLMERWEDPHLTGKVTVDAGGKTRYGISQNAYPSLDIDTLTAKNAADIAYTDYWNYSKWNISKLPAKEQPLANKLFQFGFNEGVGTVIQATNISIDLICESEVFSKLGDSLDVMRLSDEGKEELLLMSAATQLARYVVKYHGLSRVPHSLMDRALCIE